MRAVMIPSHTPSLEYYTTQIHYLCWAYHITSSVKTNEHHQEINRKFTLTVYLIVGACIALL